MMRTFRRTSRGVITVRAPRARQKAPLRARQKATSAFEGDFGQLLRRCERLCSCTLRGAGTGAVRSMRATHI
jgi:hypothetical protein